MLALLILSLALPCPVSARQIQRDREIETMHRGKQYVRAVKLYYKKFGDYPPNVDALVKTNEIRFLRKKYIDPITGKDDWKPIRFGQNKPPTAMASSATDSRRWAAWAVPAAEARAVRPA